RTVGTLADEIDGVDALLARQRRGEFSIDGAVAEFVSVHALEPSERYAEIFRRSSVEMVEEFVVPLPGVQPMLDGLRERGIAVAVLSNGWNPLQLRKAEQAGFRGTVLVSSEIGVQKPALGSFERLLEVLGTEPDRTWYVGDDPYGDVAGAQRAGIGSVWMNWERKQFPPDQPRPLHTIADFKELLELLPAPAEAR
ncbi:MAG: HAD family hydrolase, partial [Candidatus Eremiobacteraeota bacterium]|nr:HAD family hydrolase [Candidatus Eremiobacteraeota bacterium]